MQIIVTARHGHLTTEHQKEIEEKVAKLLHYFNRVEAISVTVDVGNSRGPRSVEIQLNAEHKHDFIAKESDADLLVALDKTLAKMESQIRKYKEKIQNHRKGPALRDATLPQLEE
jgi:putative sigma-54 modulation protein